MGFTLLRDNFYADVLPLFADESGVLRGPAGEGRVAAVARADVADVAAAVLRDPGAHAGATYTLTGPEALTLSEVAARAGAVLGRDLRFEDETVEEAYASRRAAYPDAEYWQLDAWVSTYTAIADGSCRHRHRRRTSRHRPRASPARGRAAALTGGVVCPAPPHRPSSGTRPLVGAVRRSGGQVVDEAPAPVLAGLGRLHDGVGALVEVAGGVPAG